MPVVSQLAFVMNRPPIGKLFQGQFMGRYVVYGMMALLGVHSGTHFLDRLSISTPNGAVLLITKTPAASGNWKPMKAVPARQPNPPRFGPFEFDSLVIRPTSVFGIYRADPLLDWGVYYYPPAGSVNPALRIRRDREPPFRSYAPRGAVGISRDTLTRSTAYVDGETWFLVRLRD